MRRLILWGPPVLYMLLIYRFSSQSDPLPVVTSHVRDKVLHIAEYAALAMLFARALAGEGFRPGRACLHALLLTAAYGALDEFHQWFVPMRTSDVLDWIADVSGAAVGALCYAGAALQTRINLAALVRGPELCREVPSQTGLVTSTDTGSLHRQPD